MRSYLAVVGTALGLVAVPACGGGSEQMAPVEVPDCQSDGTCMVGDVCEAAIECASGFCCDGACSQTTCPCVGPSCQPRPVVCEDPPLVFDPGCPSFEVFRAGQFAEVLAADCVGNLTISGPAILSIAELPAVISGDLTIVNTRLTSTTLPGLTEVRGNLDLRDNRLLGTFNPATLNRVGRRFAISDNSVLTEARFPALACLSGGGPLFGNPLLQTLDFPLLQHLQTLEVRDNPNLAAINLPLLRTVGMTQPNPDRLIWGPRELTFYRLPALSEMNLPLLRRIRARFTLEATGATRLSMPSLTATEGLYVGDNPELTTLTMPALVDLGPPAGWCDVTSGGLSDQCIPVYYVVENPPSISASAANQFPAFCTANGIDSDAAIQVSDADSIYTCDPVLCSCALASR